LACSAPLRLSPWARRKKVGELSVAILVSSARWRVVRGRPAGAARSAGS
jgi:hypothetical protein